MNFLQFAPQPTLAPLVECFWIAEGSETFSQRIVPDCFSEMIFHYGDPYVQEALAGDIYQPRAIAAGQITRPLHIRPTGLTGVLGVKFKPTAFWKLFPCNMKEIRECAISLQDVTGLCMEPVMDALKSAVTIRQRITIIESFLLGRVCQLQKVEIADMIVTRIAESRGQVSIGQLARDEKISLRKVERVFNETVGISAKMYVRLTRFNYAFKMLQQPHINKAEAAYLSGYFDQSHFNRDFKTFSGEDPGTYFRSTHAYSDFFMNR